MKMNRRALCSLLCLVAAPALAETYAVVNAKVHTLSDQGTLERGTVIIEDGKVRAVGRSVNVPDRAIVIDALGMVVTPGIFDPYSYLGAVEIDLVEGSADNALTESYGPAFAIADAINPRSTLIAINRIEGVTRALVVPDATTGGQVIAGQAALICLGGEGSMLIERRAGVVAFLGEIGSALAGGSRAGALLKLREALDDARDFGVNRSEFDRGERRPYALSRLDLEALQGVVDGDVPLIVYVERVSDIESALDLAAEFGIRLVIAGGTEAWMIRDRIAAANVPVILDPLENLPSSFDALNATLENAARLHSAGVRIAFAVTDSHNSRNLTQAAGNAVAHGLPWEEGLRAIVINPAMIFGVADDCCTIEVGKQADLVVWDGDPLDVTTYASQVFIRGERIPMHSRQTLLRDRYLDLGGDLPPAYRKP